jgi:hypothetical protein
MQKFLPLFLFFTFFYLVTQAQQTVLMGSASLVYTCDANFYDSGDLFGNYNNNENSVMTFFPDIPGRAIVAYGTLNLSGNDRLRIFCGPDTLSPLLGTFYDGNAFWVTGTNLQGAITFHFISDGASVSLGWDALVYCADYTPFQQNPCFMGCGGEHWFSDPGFGGSYAPNTDMVQTIYPVNAAYAVEITYFRDFDLGIGDYLDVHDGPSVFSPLIATYDQGNIPDAVNLYSSHPTGAITFHFVSDGFDEGLGFAGYGNGCVPTPIPDCPFQETPYDGALVNTNGTQQLVWTPNNFSGAYIAEYNVYFGTDPNPQYVGTTTDTFFTVANLLPSTQYYWWAEAVNPAGVSVACYIYNFTTSSQLTFLELFPYSGQVLEGDGIQLQIDAANVNNLNFYYSTDGGVNYYPWVSNEPFTNNYVWVPIPTSGIVTFKVEDADNPLLFDTIQVYVEPLTLSLISPNPGQEVLTNDNFNVEWASTFAIPLLSDNNVQLLIKQLPSGTWTSFFFYYFNSGGTFNEIDYFSSDVQSTLTSGEYLLKISPNYGDGDEMTSPFFIKDIIITSPNGNEQLTPGTVYPITASSNINDTYTLQYSTNGGTNWQTITNSFTIDISNGTSTTYNWTVPNIPSNNCFIRLIKPSAPGVVFDQSNNPFSILCNITASITANGSTTFCQGGSVQLAANTGVGYSYIWKLNNATISGATNANYVATAAGSYTVVVTVNGCSATSSSINVSVTSNPNAPVLSMINNCGSSTITATGVTGTLTWSDGGSGNPRTVSSGTYTVTQTSNGCTSTSSNSVTANPNVIPNAPVLSVINNCGSSTITATGVTGSLTWSDGGSGNPRTVNAGSYTVSQTSNGCTSTSSNSVTANPNVIPNAPVLSVINNCGSSTITATGVTGTLTWSDGGSGNPRTVNAGSYTVSQTSNGCTSTSSNSVTANPNVIPNAPVLSVINNCSSSTITATGVTGTLTWSDGGSGNPRTVNAGTYTVSQTSNGCTSTSSNSVTANPNVIPNAPVLSVINNCGSSTITATGVTGTLTWSDGGSGNPRTVSAGTYTVTQTSNGCTSANSNSVTANPNVIPNAPVLSVINNCGSSTITATGVTGTLIWSDGGSGNPRTVNAGAYTVTQTSNGCTSANSNSVTANPNSFPNTSIISGNTSPLCNGTGLVYSVVLSSGSNYLWQVPNSASITQGNTGPNNNSITVNFGNSNGFISVIETNANGCVGTTQTLSVLLQGCGLSANFAASATSVCSGNTVTFTNISTGTSINTTYNWNFGPNANPTAITGAGPHVVEYNGSGLNSVSLTITDGASSTYSQSDYITINPIPTAPLLSVVNNCTSSEITASAFTGSLNWSDGGSGNPRVVNSGNFSVTQTVSGCESSSSNVVSANPLGLPAVPVLTVVNNCGNSTITASGVTGALTWSDGGLGNPRTVTSGTFTVFQTLNGCASANSSAVTASPFIVPNTSVINGNQTPACLATGVNYAVSLTSGSTYAWTVPSGALITSGNSGVNNNSIVVNFGNVNGNVSVIETSANNCVGAVQTLAITMQGCGLTAGFMANDTSICSGNDVLFTDISTGTSGATTYLWNFGVNAIPSTASGPGPHLVSYVGAGLSSVTLAITDGITSTYTLNDYISVIANPIAMITANGSTSICAGDSVQLSSNIGVGYTYEWRLNNVILSNALNADYYASAGGDYTVAVSVNGCTTISDSILINYFNAPAMPIINLIANQLSSNYSNSNQWFLDGTLLLNDTLSSIDINANGNYTVCYTNSNGCSACSDPFVITSLNNISIQNKFVVYPNPFNELVYIKNANSSNQLINVALYDNAGKMIYLNEEFNTSDEIKLADLAKGVYFLKIVEYDGNISYLKLVK